MALYEHVVVTRPDISPQQVDALVEDITKIVTDGQGKVEKSEYWGLRNLSYPIKKSRKAHYSLLNIDAPGPVIHEIERRHRINEDVLRFLTVKVKNFRPSLRPSSPARTVTTASAIVTTSAAAAASPAAASVAATIVVPGDRPPREDRGDRPPRPPRDR